MVSSVPASEAASRVTRDNLETAAMLGRASPRNPRVRILKRSWSLAILLVAWRSNREQRVVAVHAAAVVGDPDQRPAALLDVDQQAGGAGVQGVFPPAP